MKNLAICFIVSLIGFNFATPFIAPLIDTDPQSIVGTWKVDLRPTPDAAPYYETFEIKSIKNKTINGSFYYSNITQSNINTSWGTVYGAFQTSDASTTYYTTFKLVNGKLEGTTHAPNRDFLTVWTAERVN